MTTDTEQQSLDDFDDEVLTSLQNMNDVYFVSDVHLNDDEPHITELFLRFLKTCAHVRVLFIVGDLFQYWIDDKDTSPLTEQIAAGLSELAEAGTEIFFIHGNRDFMLGELYAQQCAMTILPSGTAVDELNLSFVLAHGDEYCTKDVAYQRYRAFIRQPWLLKIARLLPLSLKKAIGNMLRSKSKGSKQSKTLDDMDCQKPAMLTALKEANVHILIHGHTHVMGHESFDDNGIQYQRYTMGDWQNKPGNYLRLQPEGTLTFCSFS